MQVSKEGIERIKAANDLLAVVAERGVEVKRKGRQLVARCPFHEEKTASFTLTPGKGLFHCFGCGVGGDVIGFVTRHDKVGFAGALETLARRAGLDLKRLMENRPRVPSRTPVEALTPPREHGTADVLDRDFAAPVLPATGEVLARVVEHYHRTFCERKDAQEYLRRRGLIDLDLLRALKVGYADGSLLEAVPKGGELRRQLVELGVITAEGRELMGGCVVVPLPDPLSGEWTSLYGRGLRTSRHCYLPGPLRGVLNFQAARLSSSVVLTEAVIDALSFLQAGISTAIPIYGTHGFTADHLDLLKREGVREVVLALDGDEAGERAAAALAERLLSLGLAVRVARLPAGIKDASELLASRNGDAGELLRKILDEAQAVGSPSGPAPSPPTVSVASEGELRLEREGLTYSARSYPTLLGRLRATVRVSRGGTFHVDTIDLLSSRSRAEFSRRIVKAFAVDEATVETALLALLVQAEQATAHREDQGETAPPAMSESERAEALALLRRADLLDLLAQDVDALGYVGEETNKRLLYLVAISRKLDDPLSAIVMSQSGAGKSGLTEVIERLTPPEDVVLLTRLTPQSLYYVEKGFLDRKLVIVEERQGSAEADYSIRVLQSRKKLIAAAPLKDPATGNMRTRVFTVEARAAFIEATTAASINHENATRCFELSMDESPEQTRRIHERQRLLRTERGLTLRQQAQTICLRHWNLQRLLEPLPVIIPFADSLTFPTAWMRTRRDHARFLNLIEVSAFLHQHQRERRKGAVVATTADYAIAYRLAAEVLSETLADLKRPLREAYERVRALSLETGAPLSRREIREALALPDSTVRRWLSDLVDFEYLALSSDGKPGQGRTMRYELVGRAAQEPTVAGLLSPAELASRMEQRP